MRNLTLLSLLLFLATVPSAAQDSCNDCHDDPAPAEFAESVHGSFDCVDCHSDPVSDDHPADVGKVDCGMCHDDVLEAYASSVHGLARENGATEAPGCATCHGDIHFMVSLSDPSSPVHRLRLPGTCGNCHADPAIVEKFGIPMARPLDAFRQSVHGRLTAENGGATCGDCHRSHDVYRASDPRSSVFHAKLHETCGACHAEIAETYSKSVHGTALVKGAREAPVCTDCHGEHRILSPREKDSPVFATNIPKMTCGRCHSDLRLAEKYDIDVSTVLSHEDSYHGLAARSGTVTVAHCASCHGVHDILPSSNPLSHIHPDNVAATCGNCHPGAGSRFAIGAVHVLASEPEHAAVYWVRWVYLLLIYVTIGGMILHNLLDLIRKTRTRPLTSPPWPWISRRGCCSASGSPTHC